MQNQTNFQTISRAVASHIDAEEDSPDKRLVHSEANILHTGSALLIRGATNLHNGSRVRCRRECLSEAGYCGPSLAIQFCARGDIGGGGDLLNTKRESLGIVNVTITMQVETAILVDILEVDDIGDLLVGILRSADGWILATGRQRSRPVGGLFGRVGLVDEIDTTSVSVNTGTEAVLAADPGIIINSNEFDLAIVVGDVLQHEAGVLNFAGKKIPRVGVLAVNNSSPGMTRINHDAITNSVARRSKDADVVAAIDQDTNGALVKAHALQLSLLVTGPVQADITF
ncbi:hypothetical protein HC256_004932 [Beauveria bassiana]|nr:hypothetical protein HC256_004932 [Beauveria bassiana]